MILIEKLYTFQSFMVTLFSVVLFSTYAVASAPSETQQQSKNAPVQTEQFARLLGHWKIQDYRLDEDNQWQEGPGAQWHFYWILDGNAIQDDWISPALDQPAPETGRQYGTNIRIFNPKLKHWEMAWVSNTGAKVDIFTAKSRSGNLIMKGNYNGIATRITFYDMDLKFSWKMERKSHIDQQWHEIYRIKAKRSNRPV